MAARRGKGQRNPAKERHWRHVVRKWRSSGLSVREFCDWQALSEPSFYAWRRELAKRDRDSVAAAAEITAARDIRPVKQNGPNRTPVAAFLPVRVVADGAPLAAASLSRSHDIEVHLPGGVRLLVSPGCDRALLRDVIACCVGTAPEKLSC
ncbi:MAG TPA: hypothetical protein VGZ27_17855 [Vicinamibacterales bacterium]|jgi:hypothetical protein|nr:hypothetical protein [Vicinamibacterales bacterium]